MQIKEVEKDLQERESQLVDRKHNKTDYDVWKSKGNITEEKEWDKAEQTTLPTRKKAIVIGGIIVSIIIILLLSVGSFVYFQGRFFAQERVLFSAQAPEVIDSNTLTEIVFSYENNNRAQLNNAEIIVQFGNHFIPVDNQENFKRVSNSQGVITIGEIKGNKDNEIILAGNFSGPAKSVADVVGILRYIPERTSTRYEVQARTATTIMSSPISIDIGSPQEIVSGNLMDVVISVKNTSNDNISDLKLTVKTPDNFSIYNVEPASTQTNVWLIDNIEPQSEKIIHLRGSIDSQIGAVQIFTAEVGTQEGSTEYGSYAQEKYSPRIVKSPIAIQQSITNTKNGVVYAGNGLKYDIVFTNDTDVPLRDVIIFVKFDTDVLDFSELELNERGDYDAQDKKIIWKASDVPELKVLKPGDSGKVSFTIPVLKKLPVVDENDYNFSTSTFASIDSEDIPVELRENKTVLSNLLTVPVGAKVLFNSSVSEIEIDTPLEIGKKKVYKVSFSIENINNDISNTVVTAPLPTHISFEGSDDDSIEFNERTNVVTWNVGDISHGTGILSDKLETNFDVGIVLSVDQVNSSPIIVKEQKLTADEVFVDAKVYEKNNEITTMGISS